LTSVSTENIMVVKVLFRLYWRHIFIYLYQYIK